MSGPPQHIEPSALWLKLQEMPRPYQDVDFPRRGPDGNYVGKVRMQVLTQEERMACTLAAEKFVRDKLKDGKKDELGYEDLYSDAMAVEILFRACRDVDDVKRSTFPTPVALRELSTEETAALFKHYLTVQLELGPMLNRMTEKDLEEWIGRIAEGGSSFPFDLLSSDLQKILVLFMARRLHPLPKDTFSAGSPPAEGSVEPPADEVDPASGD